MMLIGITGRKRHGKNLTAAFIKRLAVKDLGYDPHEVEELAFADPVKDGAALSLGISRRYLDEKKERFRRYLQEYGTLKRDIEGEEYWVDQLDGRLESLRNNGVQIVIITDVRFENEADFVRSKGGSVIKVERSSAGSNDDHVSESGVDRITADYFITNNGSLTDLQEAVKYSIDALGIAKKGKSGEVAVTQARRKGEKSAGGGAVTTTVSPRCSGCGKLMTDRQKDIELGWVPVCVNWQCTALR